MMITCYIRRHQAHKDQLGTQVSLRRTALLRATLCGDRPVIWEWVSTGKVLTAAEVAALEDFPFVQAQTDAALAARAFERKGIERWM